MSLDSSALLVGHGAFEPQGKSNPFSFGVETGDVTPEEAHDFAIKFGLLGLRWEMPTDQVLRVLSHYHDGATKRRLLQIIGSVECNAMY